MPAALWVIPTRVRPATVGRCVRFAGPGCPAGGPAILLFALMTTPIGGGDLRGRSPSGCLRSTPTKASEDDNHGHHQRDLHIVEVGKAKGRRREREGGRHDRCDSHAPVPAASVSVNERDSYRSVPPRPRLGPPAHSSRILERLGDTPFLADLKPWLDGSRVDQTSR